MSPLPTQESRIESLVAQVRKTIEESGDPVGFDPEAWTKEWPQRRVPVLGSRRPAEFLDSDEGIQLIRTLISYMQTGAYA